jgi:hypothetical protein
MLLEYKYLAYSTLKVEFGVAVLKRVETEAHITNLAPIYRVPPLLMFGAYIAFPLLKLLACWHDSTN